MADDTFNYGGLIGNLAGTGISAAGVADQISRTNELGEYARQESQKIGEDALAATQFTPFSVTSGTGNTQVDADGNIVATLSDPYQQLSDSSIAASQGFTDAAMNPNQYGQEALLASQGLFNQAAQGPQARQDAIFDQMNAAMSPEQERQMAQARAAAHAQGRSGITSNLYGGSGEQLAMAKAREEALLNNYVQAQGLGMAEQAQQGSLANSFYNTYLQGGQFGLQEQAQNSALASSFLQQGLLPGQQQFNELNTGLQASDLHQTGQIAGANLSSQARTTGLEAEIQALHSGNQLVGGLFGAGANIASSIGGGLGGSDGFNKWAGDQLENLKWW